MRLFGFSFGGDSGRSTHDLLKELENKRVSEPVQKPFKRQQNYVFSNRLCKISKYFQIEREIALQEAIQDRKRAYEV